MSLNKVLLIGNVGKDPDVRHLENGVSVASFSLATSEKSRDRGEVTEWHNIVAWRQQADFAANYIRKGAQLYVEGRIRSRSWDDQSGVKHYVTEIVADSLQLLGRRDQSGAQAGVPVQAPASSPASAPVHQPTTPIITSEQLAREDGADDLPF